MAFYTDNIDSSRTYAGRSVLNRIGAFLSNLGTSFIKAREASLNMQGRVAQIEALNAKSDAELAELGLRRDDITRHVFRDLYYL